MFSLLPFTLGAQLRILPMEMWSTIFRYLDHQSLLAGARSHKLWLDICRSDPVLRLRLREALKEEKNYLHNMFVNPKMFTRVSREEPAREYGINVRKSVSRDDRYLSALSEHRPSLSVTEKCNTAKRANKIYSKKRFSPYRL